MTLTWQEGWTAVIALCVIGIVFLGGEAIRDELNNHHEKPWRWGDPQRRACDEATWGSHLVIGPVCLFVAGLSVRLILGW